MKRKWTLSVLVGVCLCGPSNAFSAVGGFVEGVTCGVNGTIYANFTSGRITFDFNLVNIGTVCTVTASWTDASGKTQSITSSPMTEATVATSLGPNGAIQWSSSGSNQSVQFSWQLARPLYSGMGSEFEGSCGTSGTLYTNLTPAPLSLNISISGNGGPCSLFTLNWIDAAGNARTLSASANDTEGTSTSLPAGGTITWTSSGNGAGPAGFWQLERLAI